MRIGKEDRSLGCGILLAVSMTLSLGSCSPSPQSTPERSTVANRVSGVLLEQVDAPPYSYLRLRAAQGEVWAAVPTCKVDGTLPVTILDAVLLKDFETGVNGLRLKTVYFGRLGPSDRSSRPSPIGG
jgi:hypothetical protein